MAIFFTCFPLQESFLIRLSLIFGFQSMMALIEFECEMLSPSSSAWASHYHPNQIILPSQTATPTLKKCSTKTRKYCILNDWSNCGLICWLFWIYMFLHRHCGIIPNESQKQPRPPATPTQTHPRPQHPLPFSKHKAGYDVDELCI